ncbi:hypothetical protein [Fructilactobacillus frigidiflavus]|uniref:hypothetical protein n=1 Tax=Fructilactobacillus frigidiflavus TaxID=3242688 RepID=UPI003756A4D4
MLVTEINQVLKLGMKPKEFVAYVRQITPIAGIEKELTPTTNSNGHGDFIITERGQRMIVDLLISMSETDVQQQKYMKRFCNVLLRWHREGSSGETK